MSTKAKIKIFIEAEADDLSDIEEIKSAVDDLTGYLNVTKAVAIVPATTEINLK